MKLPNENSLNQILKQVGTKLDQPALTLDDNGKCSFNFGENFVPIQIQADEKKPVFHLIALVANTPADIQSRAALYEDLLTVNSFATENGGMTFSINASEKKVQLIDTHPLLTMGPLEFEEHLNAFLFKAESLNKSLRQSSQSSH